MKSTTNFEVFSEKKVDVKKEGQKNTRPKEKIVEVFQNTIEGKILKSRYKVGKFLDEG